MIYVEVRGTTKIMVLNIILGRFTEYGETEDRMSSVFLPAVKQWVSHFQNKPCRTPPSH